MTLRYHYCLIFLFLACGSVFANPNLRFNVLGLQGEALKNVETRLQIEQTFSEQTVDLKSIHERYQRAPAEIRKALEPFGYFHATITSHLKLIQGTWVATFQVEPGPPLRIRSVNLKIEGSGKANKKISAYQRKFPLEPGQVFRVDAYESAKEKLFEIANNQGYIKATLINNQVLIDPKANEASILIHFETGEQYYFGPLSFEKGAYSESFLRRFISFDENKPFSSQDLISLQQNMASSYFFQEVLITPDFNHINHHRVPIHISVVSPKAKKYTIGVGYGTSTGARLTGGIDWRRIGDKGHHMSLQVKLSSILSGFGAQYFIPGKYPLIDQWLLGANYQYFNPKGGMSHSLTLSGGYLRKLKHLQLSANLNFLLDRYQVDNVLNPKKQFGKLLYPSLNFSYAKADNVIDTRTGKSISIFLQGASSYVLSTTDFVQARVKGKYLFSPTSFARILLRGELGYTITHNINDLPLSMRFFAGGLNSVRGYPDSTLGPGRYLLTSSIEYQNHLFGNLDGALFYDAGNAMNHWGDSLKVGRGVGLIYRSMIGPIKVYAGQGMSKKDRPWTYELSIGPEF